MSAQMVYDIKNNILFAVCYFCFHEKLGKNRALHRVLYQAFRNKNSPPIESLLGTIFRLEYLGYSNWAIPPTGVALLNGGDFVEARGKSETVYF